MNERQAVVRPVVGAVVGKVVSLNDMVHNVGVRPNFFV